MARNSDEEPPSNVIDLMARSRTNPGKTKKPAGNTLTLVIDQAEVIFPRDGINSTLLNLSKYGSETDKRFHVYCATVAPINPSHRNEDHDDIGNRLSISGKSERKLQIARKIFHLTGGVLNENEYLYNYSKQNDSTLKPYSSYDGPIKIVLGSDNPVDADSFLAVVRGQSNGIELLEASLLESIAKSDPKSEEYIPLPISEKDRIILGYVDRESFPFNKSYISLLKKVTLHSIQSGSTGVENCHGVFYSPRVNTFYWFDVKKPHFMRRLLRR